MKISRYSKTGGFTTIDNRIARNYAISPDTKGILTHLLSFHPDTQISLEKFWKGMEKARELNPNIKIPGRDRRAAIMKEISELGYAALVGIKAEGGKFQGKQWVIFDTPEDKEWFLNRTPKNCSLGESTEPLKTGGSVKPKFGKTVGCIYNTINTIPTKYKTNGVCNAHAHEEDLEKKESHVGVGNSESIENNKPLEGVAPANSTHTSPQIEQNPKDIPNHSGVNSSQYETNKGVLTVKMLHDPLFDRDAGELWDLLDAQRKLAMLVGNQIKPNLIKYKIEWGVHPSHNLWSQFVKWAAWYLERLNQGDRITNIPNHLNTVPPSKFLLSFSKSWAPQLIERHPELAKPKLSNGGKKYNPAVGTIG